MTITDDRLKFHSRGFEHRYAVAAAQWRIRRRGDCVWPFFSLDCIINDPECFDVLLDIQKA